MDSVILEMKLTINDNMRNGGNRMAKKKSVKVYGQSGYKCREMSSIMLKELWLKEDDFDVGD